MTSVIIPTIIRGPAPPSHPYLPERVEGGSPFENTGIEPFATKFQQAGAFALTAFWSRHVGDPILKSNLTRRVEFALCMVEALENDELVHEAPAIVGRQTPLRFLSKRKVRDLRSAA
jgi:hypothetical protein